MRFLLRSPVHVSTMSPTPDRPAIVRGLPPEATARRVISSRPRVIKAARALQPKFRPSEMPQAIASTFFSAPLSSTPAVRARRSACRAGAMAALCCQVSQVQAVVPATSSVR